MQMAMQSSARCIPKQLCCADGYEM